MSKKRTTPINSPSRTQPGYWILVLQKITYPHPLTIALNRYVFFPFRIFTVNFI